MPTIFGIQTDYDLDRTYINTVGQSVVYEWVSNYVARINRDMETAMAVFVSGTTTDFAEKFRLPGGGRMQEAVEMTRPGAVRPTGSWDVGYPIKDFRDEIAQDDVISAHMTLRELANHVETIRIRNINTVRFEVLRALYNNTARQWIDQKLSTPTITVQPLANGDGVIYPPTLGSEDGAQENHYLVSGYDVSNISNTNNPAPVIVDDLAEHFGESTGGDNIVIFANKDVTDKLEGLTAFTKVEDRFIRSGADRDVPINLPMVPGVIIGRMNGAWIVRWRHAENNYAIGVHLETTAPLKMRVDPPDTGLGRGLQLVAREQMFPFNSTFWRHRFGIGVANRLNGVVMQFTTNPSYTTPTKYQ